MKLTLCIATYRREQRLAALLADISLQTRPPDELVIVDNDPAGSARAVVESHRASSPPYQVIYDTQPEKNISLTRNRTVHHARGEWIAFVDDDERAPARWLEQLVDAAGTLGADGVLGPVIPEVPDSAPSWIRRGSFYDFPRCPTGTTVPLNRLRFGNVLLRGAPVRALDPVFDPALGLTGGEDNDMLARLAQAGARLVWCDEAIVTEPVEAQRLSLRWLVMRGLRGGQDFARHALTGRYGPIGPGGRARLFMRSLAQFVLATALILATLPAGRHHSVKWLVAAAANLGKLSAFAGMAYREYA